MSMAKQETIRAIGERTRLRSHDVQRMMEALIDIWFDELAAGGRIEIENFLVLEIKTIHRDPNNVGTLIVNGRSVHIPSTRRELTARASKHLRARLNSRFDE